jgi:hypothetical protein
VVLDRDPFAGPADAIHRTRVAATYVDGQPVFQAQNLFGASANLFCAIRLWIGVTTESWRV